MGVPVLEQNLALVTDSDCSALTCLLHKTRQAKNCRPPQGELLSLSVLLNARFILPKLTQISLATHFACVVS
jgi:hypothetical protein